MDAPDADTPLESRPPDLADLLLLCRSLNEAGAAYIVVGGMAMWQHGYVRSTKDIDLLVAGGSENFAKIKQAMLKLPDGAVRDLEADDLERFLVVRVGDEFIVDLMLKTCGVDYQEARPDVQIVTVQEVSIPFANPRLMLRLKQTYREKDVVDRMFLERLLNQTSS